MDLQNKVAVITGGSQGIGYCIAEDFAKSGASVAILDLNQPAAEAAAEKLKAQFGVEVIGLGGNVAKSEDVDKAFAAVLEKFKKIDILVNNAGITKDSLLMRMDEAAWDAVLAVNLKGVFLCSKAACRSLMKSESGSIINMSSVVGVGGNAGQTNYSASKAGLIGFTKSLAKELASRNVRVNAVAPGFIRTAMTDALTDDTKKLMQEQIPLARFGEVTDIANACHFLASDASRYITGQVLRVDGGMMM